MSEPVSNSKTEAEKASDLIRLIKPYAAAKRDEALQTGNLPIYLKQSSNLTLTRSTENFTWIFQMSGFENFSLDDFIEEDSSIDEIQRFQREAQISRKLYEVINTNLPEEEGKARVAFRKVRDKNDNSIVFWRVMSIFPDKSRIDDPDWEEDTIGSNNEGIVYASPTTACCHHACDLLFKQWKSDGKVISDPKNGDIVFGYIDYQNLGDTQKKLADRSGREISGFVEFMDPETRETLDPALSTIAFVAGLYSNETNRYRIPSSLLK